MIGVYQEMDRTTETTFRSGRQGLGSTKHTGKPAKSSRLVTLQFPYLSKKILFSKAQAFARIELLNGPTKYKAYIVTLIVLLSRAEQRLKRRAWEDLPSSY